MFNATYADEYRVGRFFLVGDVAHRIPLLGTRGMNSGIQDMQNLIWKLEFALKDEVKFDKLPNSY